MEWLTFQCAACKRRIYSGYAKETIRANGKLIGTEFFCADCNHETPLAEAELRTVDGNPYTP